MRILLFVCFIFGGVSCGANVSQPSGKGMVDGGGNDMSTLPDADNTEACSEMDIVFVIDNSASMGQEQTNLAANFSAFADVLENYRNPAGESVDFRVGVTSTSQVMTVPGFPLDVSNGNNGAFVKSCGATSGWVESSDPQMKARFECMADLGTGGEIEEMPLWASRAALEGRIADGTNAGFLRDDALLGIIYITDEDDCSQDLDFFSDSSCSSGMDFEGDYVTFFDNLKGGAERWATAIIAGETDCSSSFGGAREAVRMKNFASLKGDNAVFGSICVDDLATPLMEALNKFEEACDNFVQID